MGAQGKKYQWKIGEAPPPLDEHSQTKHRLVSDYLQQYVEVVMANPGIRKLSLSIVDGFAGGGRYTNALTNQIVDGSPFLILDAINAAEASINTQAKVERTVDAEYHYIEANPEHFAFLQHELSISQKNQQRHPSIRLYKDSFHQAAPSIIQHIRKRNPKTQKAIFLLDQYAYKDVPFQTVRSLFDNLSNAEVILTFGYDAAQRYISDLPDNRKAFSNIGLEPYIAWNRIAEYKEAGMWKPAIQEQLANAIYKASGAKHITLFFIESRDIKSSYWLVHLSKVYKARDVMMDLHWKHSNKTHFTHHLGSGIFALGFQSMHIPGQNSFDFCDEKVLDSNTEQQCIDALTSEIPRIICDGKKPITFNALKENIGSFTVATEQHIKTALSKSIENSDLKVTTKKGGKREKGNTLKDTDILEYEQLPLFFY